MAHSTQHTIEQQIRSRFLQAISEIKAKDTSITVKSIMENIGDYQQGYTQMNNGRRYPTLKNIVLICQQYGVSATWLLFGIGSNGLETALQPLKRLELIEQEVQQLKMILSQKKAKK